MVDALRDLGYKNVRSAADCYDGWSQIESEGTPPSWIITDLSKDAKLSALHMLTSALLHDDLQDCSISLVLPPEEREIIPDAFALGLLSYHSVPTSKGDFKSELDVLFNRLKDFNNDSTLVAAQYLRDYLANSEHFDDLLNLEENLIRAFPSNKTLLIQKAEALLLAGRVDDAQRCVAQAKMLGISFAKAGKQLEDLLKQLGKAEAEAIPFSQAYNFKNAVIIDPDESVNGLSEQILREMGVEDVHCFTRGDDAWKWVDEQKDPPRLMVIEWRIPGLHGPAFIQRVKEKFSYCPPVLVFSSLVKKEDKDLLKEIGVTGVLEKPADKPAIATSIMNCVTTTESASDTPAIELKIKQLITSGQLDEAKKLRDQYAQRKDVTPAQRLAIDCFVSFKQNDMKSAHDLAIQALKSGGDNLFLTNLLGKIFLRLNQHDQAIRCFEKANAFSPKNIERILDLAEAQAGAGSEAAAVEAIEKAKAVDADNKAIAKTEATVMVTLGKVDFAQKLMANMSDPSDIVATLNNTAVARAKAGDVEGSLKLYDQTYASLPASKPELRALVSYNHALAYVRNGKMQEALDKVTVASNLVTKGALAEKLVTIKKQIAAAVAKGQTINVKAHDKPAVEKLQDDLKLPIATFRRLGDFQCHIVFHPIKAPQELVKAAVKNVPRLKTRQALKGA